MTRSSAVVCVLVAATIWGFRPGPARSADPKFSAEIGIEYETGDYGTGETTTTYTVPLTFRCYATERLDFKLTVPFIHTDSTSTVILGGIHGPRSHGGSRSNARASETQTGLGDISLLTGYQLVLESARTPLVRPLFYLKFPTGDEDKGLGTGEVDAGGGLELAKWMGDWLTDAELLYIIPGDSNDADLENYWRYTFSLGYAVSDRVLPKIALVGNTNAFENGDDVRLLEFGVNYRPEGQLGLHAYMDFGLTDASADFGTGASISVDF